MTPPTVDTGSIPTAPSPTATRSDRLTVLAGWALLAIVALHTLVFAVHPYWADWIAGPLRSTPVTLDEAAQFWGLPGGFVVPGALLAHLIIRRGRRGGTVPVAWGWVLLLWAAACLWIIGPSGFVLLLVPSALLILASLRARGGR